MASENLHKNIPDGQIHVPQGFVNAANGSTLTKDSSGLLVWESRRVQGAIDIGDWNMDTTTTLNVLHGLSITEWLTVRGVHVLIRDDSNSIHYPLTWEGAGFFSWDKNNFKLKRGVGAFFDGVSFDATTYNRGYITYSYIKD